MRTLAPTVAVLVALLAPSAAQAERAAAIGPNNTLVTFDTLTPTSTTVHAITGLQTAGERLLTLDMRPANGERRNQRIRRRLEQLLILQKLRETESGEPHSRAAQQFTASHQWVHGFGPSSVGSTPLF